MISIGGTSSFVLFFSSASESDSLNCNGLMLFRKVSSLLSSCSSISGIHMLICFYYREGFYYTTFIIFFNIKNVVRWTSDFCFNFAFLQNRFFHFDITLIHAFVNAFIKSGDVSIQSYIWLGKFFFLYNFKPIVF